MSLPALVLAAAVVAQAEPSLTLIPVATGMSRTVSITHAGDSRLFLTTQPGVVWIHDGTRILPEPFLDIDSIVQDGGERGLLSIAFHPRHAENGLFFVNYTDLQGNTVIARYRVVATNPNRAETSSARTILRIDQPFANHNGGQLQFGPDGFLYIGMGDGGSGGDPGNRAQNLGDLLGKILRIDVDSGETYVVPPSNPFVSRSGARPEIWALGLRNPWRFSFDRVTGDLWIADVGQQEWEEVNFQAATSIGGENYGWRRMEGTHCYNPPTNCTDGTLTLPVLEYTHQGGTCSVTGGYVYRGTSHPRLRGMYIYADYCSGQIWGAQRNAAGTFVSRELLNAPFLISTFGEDANGEMYVADYVGGSIYRLTDSAALKPRRRAARH